ncbi:MAG: cyclopropane-fatty-acyl-phospholipid synthase family protein [Actinobacteria bacterium]|nr:cyclopropane-fatty-acyl-phospholipid synthase family protein [Actinomycetota bacterium]
MRREGLGRRPSAHPGASAAQGLAPLFRSLLGDPLPVGVRFWDGSRLGPADPPATLEVRSPLGLRRALYSPDEVGFGRAYVLGEIDVAGDLELALRALNRANPQVRVDARTWARALAAAARLGVIGRPLPPPPEEVRLRGGRHSPDRDAAAVGHHYDLSNDFYGLALGPSMTYSCARFARGDETLEAAQADKHDLVCRKLGLRPGMRLLDVGCGWGAMLLHAAAHYGVDAVGITLSGPQQELATRLVAQAGLAGSVEVRLQDYRRLGDEKFDAVSSIGMFEHVGRARRRRYFDALAGVLRPQGRLLNHAISTPGGAGFGRRTFVARYVFPDGELQDLADTVAGAQHSGLEVRDVESLREHYPLTLRRWLDNVEGRWDDVVGLIGPTRARIWRLYMTGCIVSFDVGEVDVHQVLAVKPDPDGRSGMPMTRAGFV